MKTIRNLLTLAVALTMAHPAPAAVPSAINYQGRLTNASGVPQPGTRAMSLKIYDAATAGTQLYAETVGNVTVDANGVYGFQFGAGGSSNTLATETLATTDGTTLTYQKALGNTPVVAGTVSVTDGTYNWNETTGNPGSPASATATIVSGFVVGASVTSGGSGYPSPPAVTITGNGNGTGAAATATVSGGSVTAINITNAGSGYTTGATITIAPPPAPFTVNYSGGTITATYATAPAAGRSITATYRYSASGISGALAAGSEQWLELTVDGVAQSPRQKVLAVPFAMNAQRAETATNLTTQPRTSILANFSCLSSVQISVNGGVVNYIKLPYTANNGAPPTSVSCLRAVDDSVLSIRSLSTDVLASTGSGVSSNVTLVLASYSKTGVRTVIASQSLTTNGSIRIVGPFNLDHTQYEYIIECGIYASPQPLCASATMNPVVMEYDR